MLLYARIEHSSERASGHLISRRTLWASTRTGRTSTEFVPVLRQRDGPQSVVDHPACCWRHEIAPNTHSILRKYSDSRGKYALGNSAQIASPLEPLETAQFALILGTTPLTTREVVPLLVYLGLVPDVVSLS